jgi:NCAIR mutase (PurE)-related protein
MNREALKILLQDLANGKLSPENAYESLKTLPYENLEFANIDHHRSLRTGLPEVIYCPGKSPKQILAIVEGMSRAGNDILGTKLSSDIFQIIQAQLPENAEYDEEARTLVVRQKNTKEKTGLVVVVSAGTSDIPIAQEAAITADLFGSQVQKFYDVGVAGMHRLLDKLGQVRKARVVVAVAGMDGALASVVGGLVECPVIAVPTSTGYGASFQGVAALLTMLNSCAPGVATVNIDNGFGAGCLAHKINITGQPDNFE